MGHINSSSLVESCLHYAAKRVYPGMIVSHACPFQKGRDALSPLSVPGVCSLVHFPTPSGSRVLMRSVFNAVHAYSSFAVVRFFDSTDN